MYFEEFTIGRTVTTPSRTVTEEDLDAFLNLSGLTNPIFMSQAGAQASGHQGRLVPAPFQLSLAMGLAQKAGLFDQVIAVLEFNPLRFLSPVYPGDRLTLTARVDSARATSKPGRGLVVLDYFMTNQDGMRVMEAKTVYLIKQKTATPTY